MSTCFCFRELELGKKQTKKLPYMLVYKVTMGKKPQNFQVKIQVWGYNHNTRQLPLEIKLNF